MVNGSIVNLVASTVEGDPLTNDLGEVIADDVRIRDLDGSYATLCATTPEELERLAALLVVEAQRLRELQAAGKAVPA